MLHYQAIAWLGSTDSHRRQGGAHDPGRARRRGGPLRRHPAYVQDGEVVSFLELLRRVRRAAARVRRARAAARRPGLRLGAQQHRAGSSPRSRRRTPAACWCRSTPATPATRSPRWSTAPARRLVVVEDGFLGRTQVADLRAASDLARVLRRHRAHGPADLDTATVTDRRDRRGRARRSPPTTSPTSSSPPAPPGRRRARCRAHRQTIGVARAWGELGGVTGQRPLPRGQPVLPLLRLQGRHRHRAADRRDALPGRDLRPRRDDGADRDRADHRAAGRADDLHLAAQRARSRRPRPLVAAAGGDRRGRRARGADRADARPTWRSTRSSPPSA